MKTAIWKFIAILCVLLFNSEICHSQSKEILRESSGIFIYRGEINKLHDFKHLFNDNRNLSTRFTKFNVSRKIQKGLNLTSLCIINGGVTMGIVAWLRPGTGNFAGSTGLNAEFIIIYGAIGVLLASPFLLLSNTIFAGIKVINKKKLIRTFNDGLSIYDYNEPELQIGFSNNGFGVRLIF